MYNSSYQRLGSTSFRGSPHNSPLRNKTGSAFYGSPGRYPLSPRQSSPSLSYTNSSFRIPQDRQRESDLYQERSLSQLRSQITVLRQQIDASNHSHILELQQIREENDRRMNHLHSEKEEEIRGLRSRIDELQFQVSKQTSERESLESAHKSTSSECHHLRSQVSSLSGEIEYLKAQITECNKRHDNLENEKALQGQQSQIKLDSLEKEYKRSLSSLQESLHLKENNVMKLEAELNSSRRELAEGRDAADRDIYVLEQRLASTQNLLETQQHRMKMSVDDAKNESRAMMNESSYLQNELNKTRRENDLLNDEVRRLRNMVYR